MSQELLPDELIWGDGGHVSDVVLSALGDGQDSVVPGEARAHVEACAACTLALGRVALLSVYTHDRVVAAKEAGMLDARQAKVVRPLVPAISSFRVPYRAVLLAFGLALAGSIPGIIEAPEEFATGTAFVQRNLHVFMHHFITSARVSQDAASQGGLILTFGSALCLTMLAVVLARKKPARQPESS